MGKMIEKENSIATICSCSISNDENCEDVLSASCSSIDLSFSSSNNSLRAFDRNNLKIGKVLGEGSFCSVSKLRVRKKDIDSIQTDNDNNPESPTTCSSTIIYPQIQGDDQSYKNVHHSRRQRIPCCFSHFNNKLKEKKYHRITKSQLGLVNFFVERRNQLKTTSSPCYVLKQVQPELESLKPLTYEQALNDLEFESKLLSSLSHPNIISIHGISQKGASDFIILERLEKTLQQRMEEWRKLERKAESKSIILPSIELSCWTSFSNGNVSNRNSGGIKKNHRSIRRFLNESYEDRIGTALDLAGVLEYLHKNNIVYRDLKPANIGFDATGTLKLFDFGMARRLVPDDLADDGINYHITALTGTLRYMAPEVGLELPYNASADIYSWSMIFWYLLSLKVPFGTDCTSVLIFEEVFGKGVRPAVSESWSEPVKGLLERAWNTDSSIRPSPSEICSVLSFELVDCVSNSYAKEQQSS